MNDIKQLAHSLLNKSSYHHNQPQHSAPVQDAKLHQLALPKHILDHAHQYISHLLNAKKGMRNE